MLVEYSHETVVVHLAKEFDEKGSQTPEYNPWETMWRICSLAARGDKQARKEYDALYSIQEWQADRLAEAIRKVEEKISGLNMGE